MLEWVIDAVGDARSIVVVGPRRRLAHHVQWTREDPPGGGPVAALAAGLAVLADASPVTVVLAGDLPFVGAAIHPLLDAATSAGVDGALVADSNGHDQPLAAAYRRDALDRQLAALGSPAGVALRDLVRPMRLVRVADDALDCDTWDDVRRAENAQSEGSMMLQEWTDALAKRLGVDLDVDLKLVLDLARDAAHNVERPAAPVTTFLVGYAAARAGGSAQDVAQAAEVARSLSEVSCRSEPA